MDGDSAELSDGLDEFEASGEEQLKKKASQNISNKPYDEAYEISADLSMAESFDGRDAKVGGGHPTSSVIFLVALRPSQHLEIDLD